MAYEACTRVYTEISIRAEPGISNVYDDKIFIRVSTRACDRKKKRRVVFEPVGLLYFANAWNRAGEGDEEGSEKGV